MTTNYRAGHDAEKRAADYMKLRGFRVLELNWKTKYCEIDIVAEKDSALYFVEVKYRKTSKHGYGLDYVTRKKLQQMSFAADMWVASHQWKGEYQLAAIGIDGEEITFLSEL